MNDPGSKAMNRLMDGSRILGESRMIRDIDPESVTTEIAAEVIARVRAYLAEKDIGENYVARAIAISSSALNQVLNQRYKGDWRGIILDLDRWLETEIKREHTARPVDFVWTGVATEIKLVADMAVQVPGIGLVYGEPGVGKTFALKAIAKDMPGAIYVSVETAGTTVRGLIQTIAQEMHILQKQVMFQSNLATLNRIHAELKHTPRLLIVDQVHKLCQGKDDKALYTLCDLWDATESPQIWCGTIDLVAYLERNEHKAGREPLAQIRRRIAIARDLHQRTTNRDGGRGEPLFTTDQVRKVFAKNKIRLATDAVRYLTMLANLSGGGHLGDARNLVVLATKVYAGESSLTASMLQETHQLIVSRRTLTNLSHAFAQESAPPMAKLAI